MNTMYGPFGDIDDGYLNISGDWTGGHRKEICDTTGNDHSSLIEECRKFNVVVCWNNVHQTMTFFSCCHDQAAKYAVEFCWRELKMNVHKVSISDEADLEIGEPGVMYDLGTHYRCMESPLSL